MSTGDPSAQEPEAGHDVSGVVTGVLVRHVRAAAGDGAVAQMMELAREDRPVAEVETPTAWTSHDRAVALFDAAATVTFDPEVGRRVGQEMLRQHQGTEVANLLRSLGSPGELLRNVAAAASKMSTVSTLEPLSVGETQAVVRAQARLGFPRHHHLCDFTHGLLSEIPVVFGLPPAVVTESECQARGGRSCVYNVTWQRPDHPPFEFEPMAPPEEVVEEFPAAESPDLSPPAADEGRLLEPLVDEPPGWRSEPLPDQEGLAGGRPEDAEALRDAQERAEDAEARLHDAQTRAEDAETRLHDAQTRAEDTEARLHDAQTRAEDAEARLHDAQQHAADAHRRAEDAETRLHDAQQHAADAQDRADEAIRKLEEAVRGVEDARRRADAAEAGAADATRALAESRRVQLELEARLSDETARRRELESAAEAGAREREQVTRRWDRLGESIAVALTPDELERTLARVVDAAADATGARQYLLVVQIDPGGPHQLLHRGFEDEAEAQRAARQLLDPARRGEGGRLVVDVVSPSRHYGYLAVSPSDPADPTAVSLLRSYVSLGAVALDLHAARAEGRRSATVVEALVDLAAALAAASTPDEVARAVVSAALGAGAAHAAVSRLDATSGRLAVLASDRPVSEPGGAEWLTATMAAPDATVAPADVERLLEGPVTVSTTDPTYGPPPLGRGGPSLAVAIADGGEVLAILWAQMPPERHDDPRTVRRMGAVAAAAGSWLRRALVAAEPPAPGNDPVTGLPGERILEDRVDRDLLRSSHTGDSVGLAVLRVAQPGSPAGRLADDVARQVAQRLEQTLRRYDTVARLDGGDFALALPDLPEPAAAQGLAERAATAVRRCGDELDTALEVTTDVAVGPLGGSTFAALMAAVRQSPTAAPEEVAPLGAEPDGLEAELAEAVEAGQLFLLYQPLVDLQTDAVVAVEALVRWQHPRRGVLKPDAFLAAAERSDLIVRVDTWVLHEATRQARVWRDRFGTALRVSVNVSPRSLVSERYAEAVTAVVARGEVHPEMLELEVPEIVLADGVAVGDVIRRLRALGVRFAVEDFGTGAVSLQRLEEFPVSTLKIDRSFVGALVPDRQAAPGASAIIRLAADLGADCVAEGVERSEQTRILLQRGCSTAQGYYFSPPLPAGEIEDLLGHGASIHVLEPPRG